MPSALIVEDEPEANRLLAMLVQLRGYETASAFTGEEALASADRDRPDIVFLDLMLPDINGFDVCRALKSGRSTGAIPVVMVTARVAADNRLQGFRLGATDYVPKPYTPDQIFGALARGDAWRKGLDDEGHREGTIPFDPCADVDPLRSISRLQALLLARTSMPAEDCRAIHQALVDLALRGIEWGRREGVGLVATLRYQWDADRLVLTLRDESGWLAHDPPDRPDGLGGLIARCRFDEVHHDEAGGQLILSTPLTPALDRMGS